MTEILGEQKREIFAFDGSLIVDSHQILSKQSFELMSFRVHFMIDITGRHGYCIALI